MVPVAHRRDFEWLALPLTKGTRGHPYSDVGPEPWPEDELYDQHSAVPYGGLAF